MASLLVRLLFLSLSVASTLAHHLLPRHDHTEISFRSEALRSLTKDTAPTSAPPLTPCTAPQTGYILVSSNATNLNGYLASQREAIGFGAYSSVTNATEDALLSFFCTDEAARNKPFNIYILGSDGASNLPCLGGAQDSLATPSRRGTLDQNSNLSEYIYISRTPEVARGPTIITGSSMIPPVPRAVESSIWTTADTRASPMLLTPVWTNPDRSPYAPTLIHWAGAAVAPGIPDGGFALANSSSSSIVPGVRTISTVTFSFIRALASATQKQQSLLSFFGKPLGTGRGSTKGHYFWGMTGSLQGR